MFKTMDNMMDLNLDDEIGTLDSKLNNNKSK